MPARVSLILASDARVNGAVSEIMEEDGATLGAVAVMNVLDNILPFCVCVEAGWRVTEDECLAPKWKVSLCSDPS